jgi:hypothetical protein
MKRIVALLTLVLAVGSAFLILNLVGPGLWPGSKKMAFEGLPIDVARTVDFERPELEAGGAYDGSTAQAAAQREIADQLRDWLLWTVVSSASLDMQELKDATFDTPPLRRSQMEAVSTLDYGVTRSAPLRNGDVIALIPKGTADVQSDALADVVDEQRKNTGLQPRTIYVFEYELANDLASASLTRRPDVSGERMFSAASGYIERRVSTADDLRGFLSQVNDLTYVHRESDGLTLGGRRFRARTYGGVSVEDVAALWQSEAAPSSHGSGFSLDPQFDWSMLSATVKKLQPILDQPEMFGVSLRLARALNSRDIDLFLEALQSLCPADREAVCKRRSQDLVLQHRFQKARYDGKLQGTEVGMVLFYTDLIMKLWSLDFNGTVPRSVAGFPNEVDMEVAAIYQTEARDFPGTRLWLGSRDDGFQVMPKGDGLVFARTTTRVFAVPNDPFTGKDRIESAEPHVYDRTLMTWWNDHYDEVARYEPQYQRLNEIMKWSQVLAWLNAHGRGYLLNSLQNVTVNHGNWFPDWARRHPELTYKDWDGIGFKPRGYEGSTTEAMRILESVPFSAFGERSTWIGGVSLARRAELVTRSSLPEEVPVALRRGRLDFAKSDAATGKLKTLDGISYDFEVTAPNVSRMTARLDASQRLRGLVSEYGATQQQRITTRMLDGLHVEMKGAAGSIGDLRVRQAGNGFRVGWHGREVDLGQRIARRFSLESEEGLLRNADVEAALRLSNNEYLVKMYDGDRWVRLSPASAESKTVRAGYQARVSGLGDRAKNVDVAWLQDKDVPALIGPDAWVYAPARQQSGRNGLVTVGARPPPNATSQPITLRGKTINAFQTEEGLAMRWGDLPDEVKHSPDVLKSANVGTSRGSSIGGGAGAGRSDTVKALESLDFKRAAAEFADDPDAFRRALNQHVDLELQRLDDLLRAQQHAAARSHVDALIAQFGDRPSLQLRRALADLGAGRPDRAADVLTHMPSDKAYIDGFFKEVNNRLANATSSQGRQDLARMAEYVEWRSRQLHNPTAYPGEVHPIADPAALAFEWRVNRVPTHNVSRVDGPIGLIYVEDTPGLNSMQWSGSVNESLQSLVDAGRIDVKRISVLDLAQLTPSRIVATDSRVNFKLAQSTQTSLIRAGTSFPRQSCTQQQANGTGPNTPDCPSIYLVTRHQETGTR